VTAPLSAQLIEAGNPTVDKTLTLLDPVFYNNYPLLNEAHSDYDKSAN